MWSLGTRRHPNASTPYTFLLVEAMPNYTALIASNNALWQTAEWHEDMAATAQRIAAKVCSDEYKRVYKKLEEMTRVPWSVIAVIHYRECGLKWSGSLAQGDPWSQVSRHKPAGRGPFKSFMAAAVDALMNCAPFASKWKDWSPGGALTLLELYNGTGYEHHGTPSPYVWSGTQHYRHGKYVSDGNFSDTEVDHQLGCAIILHEMQKIDHEIMGGATEAYAGPNPDEYPDPQGDAPADKPPVLEQVSDKIEQAKDIATPGRVETAKSLFKSKIAWVQSVAATAVTAVLSSVEADPLVWVAGAAVLVATAVTLYFYWRDHGKGKK